MESRLNIYEGNQEVYFNFLQYWYLPVSKKKGILPGWEKDSMSVI